MRTNIIRQAASAALLCLLSTSTAFGQSTRADEARELPPSTTIERQIAGAEKHRYKFSLQKDEFVQVKVEQKDADVVVRLIDGKGTVLKEVNSLGGPQGTESVTHVAAEAGAYVIEVRTPETNPKKGNYSIHLLPPRPATKQDVQRLRAETLFAEAKAVTDTGTQELKLAAVSKLEESRSLFQELGDKHSEATTFSTLGQIYVNLGESQKALDNMHRALSIYQEIGAKSAEATTLSNLGGLYNMRGEYAKALGSLEQSLPLVRELGQKRGEGFILTNIGNTYNSLGQPKKALEHYMQAVPLHREVGEKYGEAYTLTGIGNIHNRRGDRTKALEYLHEALKLRRLVGDKRGEAQTLSNIGGVYAEAYDRRKAAEYFEMSLPLRRAAGDKYGEAYTLHNIGGIYFELDDREKSLSFLNKAMLMRRLVGDKNGEAATLFYMLHAWESWGNPRLAIFYGKQAVNKYQELRQEIRKLDPATQKTFLRTISNAYKRLAGVLIAEGRPQEAMQIINLLRDQEFFDFNRTAAQQVRRADLTAREDSQFLLLQTAADKTSAAQQSFAALKRNLAGRQPATIESGELKRLEAEAEGADALLLTTLKTIEADFKQPASAGDRVENVSDAADAQGTVRELSTATGQKTAILYTLIGDDKFHLILNTAGNQVKSFETPIKAEDLNKKILEFYALLQSPTYDPRPLGRELYGIIFKPVEAELKSLNVQILMWQLDGDLRYVPPAAFFDGEKYLVERFHNVVFTRANKERMVNPASRSWMGMGFGTSEAQTVDPLGNGDKVPFPALPGVTQELQSIFREHAKDSGVLTGQVFYDRQFTKVTLYEAMKQRRPLVHISSHFSFRPGDDTRSFLLLGDGTALTLSEIKTREDLFAGVELLTLSACNTAATQPDADGKEIDGFAELAQRLGASAVMATLWQVSDNSTPWLMREFYAARQGRKGTTKAAALRGSQLALLSGKAGAKPLPEVQKGSERPAVKVVVVPDVAKRPRDPVRSETVYISEREAPLFKRDNKRPFAHPYYWSPFVLYGNWR